MRVALGRLRRATALACLLSAAAVLSVAPAEVLAQDAPLNAKQEQGQKLYRETCFYCHSEKVWGTLSIERRRGSTDALLEQRTDLVPEFLRSVVRKGLGSMPAYRRTELTDAEVDAIIAYLTRAKPAK